MHFDSLAGACSPAWPRQHDVDHVGWEPGRARAGALPFLGRALPCGGDASNRRWRRCAISTCWFSPLAVGVAQHAAFLSGEEPGRVSQAARVFDRSGARGGRGPEAVPWAQGERDDVRRGGAADMQPRRSAVWETNIFAGTRQRSGPQASGVIRMILGKYRNLAYGMKHSSAPMYDQWRRFCQKAVFA